MSNQYESPTHRDPAAPTWSDEANAGSTSGTADVAKEEAEKVKNTSVDAGRQVADTAKEEAKNVAAEAKTQARDLLGQTRSQLNEQAGEQQKRVASGIRSIGDELSAMADRSESEGPATDLVKQAASRADGVASWLDDRDPGSLLNEVSRFARERPGTFIAVAAVAGLLAGRLTRSIVSETRESREADTADRTSTPSATHFSNPPATTTAAYSDGAATTDDFDSAGDYLGSGSTNQDPLDEPRIDEPPLSVGNEPYRSPATNPYRSDDQR